MQFLFHSEAGIQTLTIEEDRYRYLVKARRAKCGDHVGLRNLKDATLYSYEIDSIDRRCATLSLKETHTTPHHTSKTLHLGWCGVDPKTIEKTLPMLNQLGLCHITFISCDFTQRNFKIDFERLHNILINSCEQSGRIDLMTLSQTTSLASFIEEHPNAVAIDFTPESPLQKGECDTFIIGCEGGFSDNERTLFLKRRGLPFAHILKSETAAVAVTSFLSF